MKWTGLNELREKFLEFFESKGCLRLPSFSLVPKDDNSLLLINSGMAPMKKYFTGEVTPPRKRVTTCQKCIRTPDIERVGITARHGTFFEMLGNFSFGDYFKHEATAWAWEFFTKVLEMPPEKLYVSIYEDDDEAFDIWTKEVGVDPSHMVRLGKEDNFWEHGSGPWGPHIYNKTICTFVAEYNIETMGIVIGIDVGGSTTKIVGINGEQIQSPMFITATDPVTSLFGAFGKYIYDNGIQLSDIEQVMLTGVGSAFVDSPLYGLPTDKVDEFIANGLGARHATDIVAIRSLITNWSISS